MKRQVHWWLSLLVALSMVLAACGGAATPAPVEPTSPPPTEVMQEAEPTAEPMMATEADLDAAYSTFLSAMAAYNTISLDAFAEKMAEDPAPFVLDVREISEVEGNGRVPGAVVIPLRTLGQNLDKLPSFDTTIVSYCGSGWRCTIAMAALGALGWNDVLSLKGGSFGGYVEAGYPVEEGAPPEPTVMNEASPDPAMASLVDETLSSLPDGWAGISVDDLAALLTEDPELILIDVRRQEEIDKNGYIESDNLSMIPLEELIDRRAEWPTDKSASIVVYCGSGHRSTIAMTILRIYGYQDVLSMKGGFGAWTAAGYPAAGVADLDSAYSDFLSSMVGYNTIGLADLNAMLAEEPPPFVLDVRSPSELEENGYIQGAVNIELHELMKHLDLLPSFDTTIVSYCGSGWRCTIAMTALGALGWQDVRSLKGGSFGGWVSEGYPVEEGMAPEAPALNAASPDPAMVALMDEVFTSIPAGFGGVSVDDLASELVENPSLTLIDVRRAEEVADNGVIDAENLTTIPLEELISRMADWPANKSEPIVVYCGSGHRSTIAMTILWSYGYTNVRSMKGGFGAWTAAGYPVAEMVAQ
jgi:rhodanese-related sulfurtransferase